MNELQRTEYLTALGITSYMPRFRLPLAAEPLQAPLPPPPEAVPDVAPAAAVMAAVDTSAGTGAESVASGAVPAEISAPDIARPVDPAGASSASAPGFERVIGSITSETKIGTVAKKVVPVSAPQQAVKPFVLSCWWLGEDLLAVDSRAPGTALPVEALFGNIVRALGWHQLSTERDKFKWPLAENPFAAAADASDARDTCSSWLEAAYARKPVKSIWLMGSQAQEFCSPLTSSASPQETVSDWQGVAVVSMPSLTELLTEPARKRDLWQLLRKLYPEQTRR